MHFKNYPFSQFYDEMINESGNPRDSYEVFKQAIENISLNKLNQLQHSTRNAQRSIGMTFNVYHDNRGIEKILHLDLIPRIIAAKEWKIINEGLVQRIEALNLFIDDIYHKQQILKDGTVPKDLILTCKDFLKPCMNLNPPQKIWCHITGSDLVRNSDGEFYVLEDNLRCPSGVSYMLENREIVKNAFSGLFSKLSVRPIKDYADRLRRMLSNLSEKDNPTIAVLTPGIYNSAYFEHSYLAQQMGVELVTGQDLVVQNKRVYMQTTQGLEQLDIIYRRIDDTFLDPTTFNKNSLLGVPGIFEAYKDGNVAFANAPGTGIADDKAVYTYVPKIIKYYLGQDPIIQNVPTYLCSDKKDMSFVLENIASLVVKETSAAGGYGMLIGPKSTKKEHQLFKDKIVSDPRKYIAQPTLSLSTVPTLNKSSISPRHVDLRPYILYGKEIEVVPGALTRVALKQGSLVVNSSQGGGSKDTWVLNQ